MCSKFSITKSLKTLKFGLITIPNNNNKSLNQEYLSDIEVLSLKGTCNSEIKVGDLPNKLKKLVLGEYFTNNGKDLEEGVFPSTLKSLTFGKFDSLFCINLKPGILPENLEYLKFGGHNHKLDRNVFPNSIVKLDIGFINQDLSEIVPKNYKSLIINKGQEISNIPESITELRFRYIKTYCFNNSYLNSSSIPNSVKILELSKQIILNGGKRLPESITELKVDGIFINQNTFENYLPLTSIKILKIGLYKYKSINFNSPIFSTIKVLSISPDFIHNNARLIKLPNSLISLQIENFRYSFLSCFSFPSTLKVLSLCSYYERNPLDLELFNNILPSIDSLIIKKWKNLTIINNSTDKSKSNNRFTIYIDSIFHINKLTNINNRIINIHNPKFDIFENLSKKFTI